VPAFIIVESPAIQILTEDGIVTGGVLGLVHGVGDGDWGPVVAAAPVQVVPLKVNAAGAGLLPAQVPLKPKEADAPVPTAPL
jgi:hypothetical protein